jgi:hypothetical protein
MNKVLCLFFLITTLIVSGCQTGGIVLRETPLNISGTRKSVVSVIGEPRSMSENGRELFSKYYDKKGKDITKMNMVRERYYTHVTILGDRRPYDIQVEVVLEGRVSDEHFELIQKDDDKATTIAEKIKKVLNQSRDNRNIIDDFRSF